MTAMEDHVEPPSSPPLPPATPPPTMIPPPLKPPEEDDLAAYDRRLAQLEVAMEKQQEECEEWANKLEERLAALLQRGRQVLDDQPTKKT